MNAYLRHTIVNVPGYDSLQIFVIDSAHFKQCIEKDVRDLTRVSIPKKGAKLEDPYHDIFHWKVGKKGRVFAMFLKNNQWVAMSQIMT